MSSELKQQQTMADVKSGVQEDLKYLSKEFQYIVDENNGSYSEGSFINYDLTPISNQWVNLSQSYVALPLTITNAAYTNASIVALKQSVLSLISGSQLTTTTGQTVYNQPQNMDVYSNTKLMIDSTPEQVEALRSILIFAKDESNAWYDPLTTACTGIDEFTSTSVYAAGPPIAVATTTTTATTFNSGMRYRYKKTVGVSGTALTTNSYDGGSTSFALLAYIPLRYIHPVFEKLDFPILGANFKLQLTLNVGNRSFVSSAVPSLSVSRTVNGLNRSRLYVQVVKLAPEIEIAELKKLQSGITRLIKFTDFDQSILRSAQTSTAFNEVLSNGTVKPTRIISTGFSAAKVYNNAAGSIDTCANYILKFSDVNVMVNGAPLYKQALSTLPQQYEEYLRATNHTDNKDSKLQSKSYISYDDFNFLYRINTFDLSSVKSMLSSETQPVRLEIQGTRSDATSIDYVFFIEKEKLMSLTLNGKICDVLVSQ